MSGDSAMLGVQTSDLTEHEFALMLAHLQQAAVDNYRRGLLAEAAEANTAGDHQKFADVPRRMAEPIPWAATDPDLDRYRVPDRPDIPAPAAVGANNAPLVHVGETTLIYGRPGAGKSWCGVGIVRGAAGRVLWIAYEKSGGTIARLRRAFDSDPTLEDRGRIASGHDAQRDPDSLIRWLNDAGTSLVVIDSYSSAGVATDGTNAAEFLERVVWPWRDDRRAIVALAHAPKKRETGQQPGPLGSATLTADVDAQYFFEADKDHHKRITDGRLTLDKQNELWSAPTIKLAITDGLPVLTPIGDIYSEITAGNMSKREASRTLGITLYQINLELENRNGSTGEVS